MADEWSVISERPAAQSEWDVVDQKPIALKPYEVKQYTDITSRPGPAQTGLTGALSGAGGELLSTGMHAADLLGKITGASSVARALHLPSPLDNPTVQELIRPPQTTAEHVGSALATMGEFAAPGGLVGKGVKAAEAASAGTRAAKVLPYAARVLGEGAASTGVEALRTGGDVPASLGTGGASALVSAILPGLGAIGRKIQMSTIRPRAADVLDSPGGLQGFKSVIASLGLKGNLEQSLQQVEAELAGLRAARNAKITPGTATVDLNQAFSKANAEIAQEITALKYAGEGKQIVSAMRKLETDILSAAGGGRATDVRIAENAKEHLGLLGSWSNGRPDRDAAVTEAAANKLYFHLKTAINDALGPAGPEVQALNRRMQQVIPVRNAMLARLPVEERNRLLSLTDIAALLPAAVTGNISEIGLLALTRAQKALRFGNRLATAGAEPVNGWGQAGRAIAPTAVGTVLATHPKALPGP